MSLVLRGRGDPVTVDPEGPVRVIGERINPSGRKAMLEALRSGGWEEILRAEAIAQAEAGAQVIDVNVGGKGVDEAEILPEAVRIVAAAVDLPLSIDTRNPAALEKALALCPGRPLVNSIGGEDRVLAENLPIAADYGVPVVALCMGQEGIPKNADERLSVAHRVLDAAVKAGIREEDVIFDPLIMTVGADDQAARTALETIRRLRAEFPVNCVTGGASNVSFGMPCRAALNARFLSVAIVLGLNLPITDPTIPDLRWAIASGTLFLGRDRKNREYMRLYRELGQEG